MTQSESTVSQKESSLNATSKDAVSKLVKLWENKNAKRAVKGAGLSLMALSLAACGGSSVDTPYSQADLDAAQQAQADAEAALLDAQNAYDLLAADADATQIDLDAALADLAAATQAYDDLVAAAAALDARTLDADNETFAAGADADYEVIVAGTTSGADALAATVTGTGTGTLTFTFADADDLVVLTADSDISSYTALEITGGTVDVTNVDTSAIETISIASGIQMTAAQFLALSAGAITTADTGSVVVTVSTVADVEAVIAAASNVSGAVGAFDLETTVNSGITSAQLTSYNADLDAAILANNANDLLPTALQTLADAQDAVVVAEGELAAGLVAVGDANGDGTIGTGEDTYASVADVTSAYNTAAESLDGLTTNDTGNITGEAFNALTAASQNAVMDAQIASLNADITLATADLAAAEAAFDAAGGAGTADAISAAVTAYEDAVAAAAVTADAVTAAVAAEGDAEAAASALIASETGTVYDAFAVVAADAQAGTDVGVILEAGTTATTEADVVITTYDAATNQIAIDTTVAVLDAGVYTITGDDDAAYTITASYLDALVAAQNAVLSTTAADTAADLVVTADIATMEAAFEAGGVTLAGADTANGNSIDDGVDEALATLNDLVTAVTDSETALSVYNTAVADWQAMGDALDTVTALDTDLTDAGTAVTNAENVVSDLGVSLVTVSAGVLDYTTQSATDSVAVLDATVKTLTEFGAEGIDRLFIGTDYTVVDMTATETINDNLGNLSVLEVFVKEYDTGDNGTIDGVKLYFETETFGGNGAGTDNIQTVDIAGVTLADLTFLDNGILVGEVAVA